MLASPTQGAPPDEPDAVCGVGTPSSACVAGDERQLQLYRAVADRNAERVRRLLAAGAHPDTAAVSGATPLELAVGLQPDLASLECILALLEAGASIASAEPALRAALDHVLPLVTGPGEWVLGRSSRIARPASPPPPLAWRRRSHVTATRRPAYTLHPLLQPPPHRRLGHPRPRVALPAAAAVRVASIAP